MSEEAMTQTAVAGYTLSREMDTFARETLWELFSMPGWEMLEQRLRSFESEYAGRALNASRESESDRYEIGRYDGVQEAIVFLSKVVMDARPSY